MLHSILAAGALLCPPSPAAPSANITPLELASDPVIRLYDLGALTGQNELDELENRLSDARAEPAALRRAFDEYVRTKERHENLSSPSSIVQNIERFLTPAPSPEFEAIVLSGDHLAVSASPVQHAWIQRYLDTATGSDRLVELNVKLFRLEPGSLSALGIEEAPQGRSVPSAEALNAKISAFESSETVTAPRITVHPGAKASVEVVHQIAYVKDCEVKMVGDPAREVVDPVIDVLKTGFVMKARALPIGQATTAVHAEVSWTQRRQLREVVTTLGGSTTPVTIQLPELVKISASARFDIQSKAAIIMTSIDPGGEGQSAEPCELVAVLSAQQVEYLPEGGDPEGPDDGE